MGYETGESAPAAKQFIPRMPRRNLMLAASIRSDGVEAPVRIRNLSETGAMVEGAALPVPGTRLSLRRLDIEIGATVIWLSAGRSGIQFDASATVEDWVGGVRTTSLVGLRGQARVDAVQAAIRAGVDLPPERQETREERAALPDFTVRLSNELTYLERLLNAVGEELVADPLMVQRHGQAMQNFDVACQILTQLSTVICAASPEAAARDISMQSLRARLLGKPLF